MQIDTQYHLDKCTTEAEYAEQMTQPVPGEWHAGSISKTGGKRRPLPWPCSLALIILGLVMLCVVVGLAAGL